MALHILVREGLMYIIVFIFFAVLGFAFHPLWIIALIFFGLWLKQK